MSMTSQDYADLAIDSYTSRAVTPPGGKSVKIGQHSYRILDHQDNPRTGYQGTIYQRADTGEIVVAHRGTEFDREAYKDGVLADGGMVLNRSNLQATDAIALTRKAMLLADDQSVGDVTPPVVWGKAAWQPPSCWKLRPLVWSRILRWRGAAMLRLITGTHAMRTLAGP